MTAPRRPRVRRPRLCAQSCAGYRRFRGAKTRLFSAKVLRL